MFRRRDRDSAMTDLGRMAGDIKHRLDCPARGAVYVSCLARGPNPFGSDPDEIGLIQPELASPGAVPPSPIGFFANGEISHHRLDTQTGRLTVFVSVGLVGRLPTRAKRRNHPPMASGRQPSIGPVVPMQSKKGSEFCASSSRYRRSRSHEAAQTLEDNKTSE